MPPVPIDPTGPPLGPPCKSVTVTVISCETKNPIHNFNAFDKNGSQIFHNDPTNNYFAILCGLPGYKVSVGAPGFVLKEHLLTSQEVQNQFAEVCLVPEPPKPTTNPYPCAVEVVLTDADQTKGAAKGVLHLYRQLRDHIASTPLGKQWVLRYYEDAVQSSIHKALRADRQLGWELLVLLVEVQPLITSLLRSSDLGSYHHHEPVLDEALSERIVAFGEKLNMATEGAITGEMETIKALLQEGPGHTSSELFLLLQSATVHSERTKPKRARQR